MAQLLYNVVVRTTLDELPILITPSRANAKKAIKLLTLEQINRAADVMQVDHAGLCKAAIITYRNGIPIKLTIYDLPASVTAGDPE